MRKGLRPELLTLLGVLLVAGIALGGARAGERRKVNRVKANAPEIVTLSDDPERIARTQDGPDPVPFTPQPGIQDGPEGFPPPGFHFNQNDVPAGPAPEDPFYPIQVVSPHCATNLVDCASAAQTACEGAGQGGARTAALAWCEAGLNMVEGCCAFTCERGATGTCRAG